MDDDLPLVKPTKTGKYRCVSPERMADLMAAEAMVEKLRAVLPKKLDDRHECGCYICDVWGTCRAARAAAILLGITIPDDDDE